MLPRFRQAAVQESIRAMSAAWSIQIPHDIQGMGKGPRLGRNPYEGYVRACGLQYGNVQKLCEQDEDFQAARRLAQGRTIVTPLRLMNLFLLIKFFLPKIAPGHIFEFGSYKGGGAIFMAYLAQRYLGGASVWGFDTFSGMPPSDQTIDIHRPGEFQDVDLNELRGYVTQIGLTNLRFVQGRFEETTAATLQAAGPLALIHIDCDIFSSVAYCYDAAKVALVRGGYVVLDDPLMGSCLGAFEAMEQLIIRRDGLHAEQVFPTPVFRYPPI
jgi:predicted O-methyltransferase YrrM